MFTNAILNLRIFQSDYGGVEDIRVKPNMIWTPDLLLYNSASENFDVTYQTNVVVSADGLCNYIPPGIFQSTCKVG